ncbi:MAG: MOSC domain-containing protein [Planctomycetota bacterium]
MITILSLQIGRVVTEGDPNQRGVLEREWTSAFRKQPIDGPIQLHREGLAGDSVADRKHHGGPEKAVLCYAAENYEDWKREHPELEFGPGGFGENLLIGGASEATICIGDQFAIGDCQVEVSQPRQPCWKISRRWGVKTMTKEVTQTGRTGWYLRILQPGTIQSGDKLESLQRPNPSWTITRANDVLFGREVDRMSVMELMNLPELSDEWKKSLS